MSEPARTDGGREVDPRKEAAAADAAAAHDADRPPTPDEEREAEAASDQVDPATADHYREMAERGAHAKGEGRIEPG